MNVRTYHHIITLNLKYVLHSSQVAASVDIHTTGSKYIFST